MKQRAGPCFNHHQNSARRPPRDGQRERRRERRNKREIVGLSRSGPHPFWGLFFPVLGTPYGPTMTHTRSRNEWPKMDWPRLNWPKLVLAKISPFPRHTGASRGVWRGSWREVVSRDTNHLETSKGVSLSRGFLMRKLLNKAWHFRWVVSCRAQLHERPCLCLNCLDTWGGRVAVVNVKQKWRLKPKVGMPCLRATSPAFQTFWKVKGRWTKISILRRKSVWTIKIVGSGVLLKIPKRFAVGLCFRFT